MKKNFLIKAWITFLVVILLITNKYGDCNHRVPITYLITSFSIFTLFVIQYWISKKNILDIRRYFIPLFIITIITILGINLVKINGYLQIFLFATLVFNISLIISPIYYLGDKVGVIKPVLTSVIILSFLLSLISYFRPNLVTPGWANILGFSLLGLIILQLSFLLFPKLITKESYHYLSYFGIVLFSAFILYDTKLMRKRAELCDQKYNYLGNTVSLFLDFINLFTNSLSAKINE